MDLDKSSKVFRVVENAVTKQARVLRDSSRQFRSETASKTSRSWPINKNWTTSVLIVIRYVYCVPVSNVHTWAQQGVRRNGAQRTAYSNCSGSELYRFITSLSHAATVDFFHRYVRLSIKRTVVVINFQTFHISSRFTYSGREKKRKKEIEEKGEEKKRASRTSEFDVSRVKYSFTASKS